MMGLHKLTAGDGYSYLTRQVAVADSTERGASSLADYYSEKGESPGRWMGSGLTALGTITAGEHVGEPQMQALFGEGLHPDADAMFVAAFAAAITAGHSPTAARTAAASAGRLGRAFKIDSGATDFRIACAEAFVGHNLTVGQKWNTPIAPDVRARIRTDVAAEMFRTEYSRGPIDARELSGWVAAIGRQKTKAVAGYDLTFTPVKSVSALWAIAPRAIGEQIEAAHAGAIAAAIAFLETNASFTRTGTNGVAQVDTDGLICAAFTHRDSRAGDPNLHTHVAISNKVRAVRADGTPQWLALDGRPLYRNTVTASEIYNTVLEAQIRERVGGRFAERAAADTRKRPVRELVGMSEELCTEWSSRRTMIVARTGELSAQFQRDHGREPTAIEAISLAQQATLDTRAAKHEPRSHADQRAQWRTDAVAVLGSERAVAELVASVTTPHQREAAHRSAQWVNESAAEVLAAVSRTRARWQISHVRAEAVRVVRREELPQSMINPLVDRVVAAACDRQNSIDLGRRGSDIAPELVPAPMRRRDGTDVHTTHESALFTTDAVLDAEARIVNAARRTDGRVAGDVDVDMALLESVANGTELNTGQSALVRQMATSGARVQLALAPAGTGKTTAMRALTRAWTNSGGRVVGFAPTALAAAVLRADIDTATDTLAKFIDLVDTEKADALARRWVANPRERRRAVRSGRLSEQERRIAALAESDPDAAVRAAAVPDWFSAIGPDTLVIVDEAGMTGTLDLDSAIAAVLARGASVRLVGDDQQLASISAGGVLRDIHDTVGALTLSNVVRFADPSEGAASLALRDGDDAAIAFYLDHGRVHIGSERTVTDDAYAAWATDRAAGKDAVLLAPTRDVVNALNARARTDRLAALGGSQTRERTLSDGLQVSAGDIVCTRKNDRRLPITATDWVRNGDRWIVESVGSGGELVVRHLGLGRTVTLPPVYVGEDVTLGYAATIHAAQGMTADTCHVVATGAETRQLAYVALTRGRYGNHLYLPTASDGDLHLAMTERGMLAPTAVDDFRTIVRRDGAQKSAISTVRELDDPAANLGHAAYAYDDAVGAAAEAHLGPEAMAVLDIAAGEMHPGLTDAPAWPVLRRHLATIAVGGQDPIRTLARAIASRELGTADDVAAVLDRRLDPSGTHSVSSGPLPWLPAIAPVLGSDDAWGPYLRARRDVVTDHAAAVRDIAHAWTPATAPAWARPLVGVDTALVGELAVFRAAREIDDADRRPAGPEEYAAAPRRTQEQLHGRARALVGAPNAAAGQWQPLVDDIDRHIARDPYWPDLAEHLATAARAGLDVPALVRGAAGASPLPDELPAAALWWRLSGMLSSGSVEADGAARSLRPVWTAALVSMLGNVNADRVMADAGWPALIAVVESADPARWTPDTLLGTAYELLHGGADEPDHVRPDELATALTWRAEMLIREHVLADRYIPAAEEPLSVDDEERLAPPDTSGNSEDGLEPGESAEWEIPGEVPADADYYASLDALESGDSDDKAPPETGEDVLDADTAAWMDASADMSPPLLEYPSATADERVALLRTDAEAARAEVRRLRSGVLTDTGAAALAAAPMLAELRTTAERQRPALNTMMDARADAISATLAVEDAEKYVAALRADLATAETNSDTDVAEAIARDIDWEQWHISTLAAVALDAQELAAAAETAYADIGSATGGHVTAQDVEFARLAATSIDAITLNDATAHLDYLSRQLGRAEQRAASEHAHTRARLGELDRRATSPASDRPVRESTNGRTGASVAVAEPITSVPSAGPPAEGLGDLRAAMRTQPIRLRTDSELAESVSRARRVEQQIRYASIGDSQQISALDSVTADHARLGEQASAIRAAREAEQHHADAEHQSAAAQADVVAARRRLETATRRGAHTADRATVQATNRRDNALEHLHTADEAARSAAAAVGPPERHWPDITGRAADTAGLAAETYDARTADHTRETAAAEKRHRDAARRRALDIVRAEQDRRTNLTPAERRYEDRIRGEGRAPTDEGSSPTTTWEWTSPPPTAVEPRIEPDRRYDPGL